MESPYHLDEKQLQALKLLATGMQRREVARVMGASETTFGRFLTGIYASMQARSTIETVAKAMAYGVLEMDRGDFKNRGAS